jgi:hypothetical protein
MHQLKKGVNLCHKKASSVILEFSKYITNLLMIGIKNFRTFGGMECHYLTVLNVNSTRWSIGKANMFVKMKSLLLTIA